MQVLGWLFMNTVINAQHITPIKANWLYLIYVFFLKLMHLFAGGTNEGDHSDSSSMRKCLRKTRGELLFREYEVLACLTLCFHLFRMPSYIVTPITSMLRGFNFTYQHTTCEQVVQKKLVVWTKVVCQHHIHVFFFFLNTGGEIIGLLCFKMTTNHSYWCDPLSYPCFLPNNMLLL